MAAHAFENHVGEVLLRVHAESLPSLFREVGLALAELALDVVHAPPADAARESVVLSARDREALLVEWVNELVYRSETRKKVYTELEVERVEERELSAKIRGVDATDLRTAVKAATYHALRIEEGSDGFNASIVLDV
jgi:SHS2 domain-containing protein